MNNSKKISNTIGIIILIVTIFISGCQKYKSKIELINFNPIANFTDSTNFISLNADLTNALVEGIKYPTKNQSENGKFQFKFQLINNSDSAQKLYYKIYYQNESYKYPIESEKSIFNFYGSWQDTDIGYKAIKEIPAHSESSIISDYIQIVGNPRNEKRYFGAKKLTQQAIDSKIKVIKGNKKWMETIHAKAKKKKRSLDQFILAEAKYVLNQNKNINLRWRRNPRAGLYSFLLVIVDQKQLNSIPKYIKHINETDSLGLHVNPYKYFLHTNKDAALIAKISDTQLKTYMVFDPKYGILAKNGRILKETCNCGKDSIFEQKANFKEFNNAIFWKERHHNIPVIANVDDNYTRDRYNENAKRYPTDTAVEEYWTGMKYRIKDMSYNSDSTCAAVKYDSLTNSIWVINKGNDGKSHPRKQNAGIMTRFGFTYGKVTGKIKFPELMNKHNVWNGVTNAFWVINQSGGSWNNRSECKKKGYVAKKNGKLGFEPYTSYSEIDFEIIKTSKYAFSKEIKKYEPDYDPQLTDNIIVACTNHDIGCQDPVNYSQSKIKYGDTTFRTYRWYPKFRSKFIRTPINEDKIFKRDYYYFQIGWYPDSIVWKIGPSMDKLYTVGYMDKTITKIPDNQMLAVMSQEFHHGDWWPPVAFHQDNIPYPKNDIIGKLFEIRIE